ncbi:hypothetical protein CIK06_18260 [Plantactinospora sp. KBS50]|nr:hypothetical protein CIK06_18260 [Plantactinospora sp. KBS50]
MERAAATNRAGSDCPNYVMLILNSLASRPDDVVVKWRDQSITAGEFLRATVATTRRMQELGVDRTHTVAALSASNSPTVIYTRYAAHLLGARLVHILSVNANSAAESLAESQQVDILDEVGATLLAVDLESLDVARRLKDQVKGPLKLATHGRADVPVDADLSATPADDGALPEPRPIIEGDTATIIYTSGTTGRPKGICRSYGSWHRETVGAMAQVKGMNLGASAYLVTIPLSNAGISVDSVLAHEGWCCCTSSSTPAGCWKPSSGSAWAARSGRPSTCTRSSTTRSWTPSTPQACGSSCTAARRSRRRASRRPSSGSARSSSSTTGPPRPAGSPR